MYTLKEIARITGIRLEGDGTLGIEAFFHDSRSFRAGGNALFIALESERNNGHMFIPGLVERGNKAFLIREGQFDTSQFLAQGVSFLISPDPLSSIQMLAAAHRQRFEIPVIGITGSNGKTMVKEWLYQLLKPEHTICRSPKSYNSQIGVPLSVLNLGSQHTLAIFEAGISRPGEMDRLAKIISPDLGIFTSLGSAHDEGFSSLSQKLSEKLLLFRDAATVVVNYSGDLDPRAQLKSRVVRISEKEGSEFHLLTDGKTGTLRSAAVQIALDIPFADAASITNAATCAAVMLELGYNAAEIERRLRGLEQVALRLESRSAINNSLVINDYYNSDLDSLKIALDYLDRQRRRPRKIVVVSDIEQSGMPPAELYQQLSRLFSQHRLDLVIGIGGEISKHAERFPEGSIFFPDTTHFAAQFKIFSHLLADATILLKGARSFGFEAISGLLQLKSHDTVFEINLDRLTENVNYYRSLTGPIVKLMCMVKATGYGSGSAEIARTLEHCGVSYLAVAYADEGVELRESMIDLPVMVMSPEEGALNDIIQHSLEPELYSFRMLQLFLKALDAAGVVEPYPVHIKIDTGMHRLGFQERDLPELVNVLKNSSQLKVVSVFSHLAASDNPSLDDFTHEQLRVFGNACTKIEAALGRSVLRHICNSAGISRFPQAHYNMVRLGIGMYGIGSSEGEQASLQNVGTLKTRISQIKSLGPRDTVGYNRGGRIERPTQVAVIPIGYADGFSRLLGNGRHGVYIAGKFCKTIGSVCMDMCMIDVTDVNCKEGDEAIVFSNTAQIRELAAALGTIPYEVLTSVSARVKRIYVHE